MMRVNQLKIFLSLTLLLWWMPANAFLTSHTLTLNDETNNSYTLPTERGESGRYLIADNDDPSQLTWTDKALYGGILLFTGFGFTNKAIDTLSGFDCPDNSNDINDCSVVENGVYQICITDFSSSGSGRFQLEIRGGGFRTANLFLNGNNHNSVIQTACRVENLVTNNVIWQVPGGMDVNNDQNHKQFFIFRLF